MYPGGCYQACSPTLNPISLTTAVSGSCGVWTLEPDAVSVCCIIRFSFNNRSTSSKMHMSQLRVGHACAKYAVQHLHSDVVVIIVKTCTSRSFEADILHS